MNGIPNEVIHKELDLIQKCVERMSHNSFIIKGWTVLLFSGAFVFWENHPQKSELLPVVVVSLVILWGLDAYFLQQERSFRQLYAWVIEARKNGNTDNLYNLDYKKVKCCSCILKALFAPIMLLLYVVPLCVVIGLFLYNCDIKITYKGENKVCKTTPAASIEKDNVSPNYKPSHLAKDSATK